MMEELEEIKTELGGPNQVPWRDFELLVTIGPRQGARLRVDATTPRRVVGQSRSCELVLEDPAVSRRHVAAESTPQGLVLTDLASSNGTFLNGVRILSAFANANDRIRLGKTELRVEMAPASGLPAPSRERFGRIIGASEAMQRLYPIFERLAVADGPVIIEGPQGTGKELLAETLHEHGARAKGPFIVFDCAAVPTDTMLRGLVGYLDEAGRVIPGALQQAEGGTLFIDELAYLEPQAQLALLAAIERGQVPGPSGAAVIKVDVRVVATTRRDLEMAVQHGRFREDLYFKLAALRVELPPLRERRGDAERLILHFWSEFGGRGRLAEDVVRRLAHADWLGNVSELRSAVARIVALGDLGLESDSVSDMFEAQKAIGQDPFERVLAEELALPVARQRIVDAFERSYISRALERAGGNVTAAAAASGIARRYFYTIKKRSS